MTTRSEEVPHIRSVFRQSDDNGKIRLVERLSDVAREYLPAAVVAKVPQPYFSKQDRAAYKAIGQSLEWNLTILGDTGVYAFCFAARDAGLTKSQQSAAALLYACFEALDANLVSDHIQQCILDAYSGLELDAVATGKKFTQGRKQDTGSAIRKAIAKALKKNPALKNAELWNGLSLKPPKGWEFFDNGLGKYTERLKAPIRGQSYARFCNVASEERKKLKE